MMGTLFGSSNNEMRPVKLRLVMLVSCFVITSAVIGGTIYAINAPKGEFYQSNINSSINN